MRFCVLWFNLFKWIFIQCEWHFGWYFFFIESVPKVISDGIQYFGSWILSRFFYYYFEFYLKIWILFQEVQSRFLKNQLSWTSIWISTCAVRELPDEMGLKMCWSMDLPLYKNFCKSVADFLAKIKFMRVYTRLTFVFKIKPCNNLLRKRC